MNTPKFKKGDWIKRKKDGCIARVVMLLKTCYDLRLNDGECWWLDYDYQDNWELTDAPSKDASDKSLEEEARLYSDNQDASDYPDLFSREDIKSAFIAGAEWMKAKMLKLIETRISEIIGDAQPNPVLRIELQSIIDKIK